MEGYYVNLEEQQNEFGDVFLDVKNHIFYLFLNDEYLLEEDLLDDQKFYTPAGLVDFSYHTLLGKEDKVLREGWSFALSGQRREIDTEERFGKDGKIRWNICMSEWRGLYGQNDDQEYEKLIAITNSSENNFNCNYIYVNSEVEMQVVLRKTFAKGTEDEKVVFYEYKCLSYDPDQEFDCCKVQYMTNMDPDTTTFYRYTKELWDGLTKIADTSNNFLNDMDNLLDTKKRR